MHLERVYKSLILDLIECKQIPLYKLKRKSLEGGSTWTPLAQNRVKPNFKTLSPVQTPVYGHLLFGMDDS